jgi:diadenosine tetraphosphatase ApaH/serine/threonine PP2A family protein phosphatase
MCVKESKYITVGNHDWATLNKTNISVFNSVAAQAIRWTQKIIKKSNLNRLKRLPLTKTIDNILLVHSTPRNPAQWHYLFSLNEFEAEFSFFDAQVCFIGHSHIPSAVFQDANGYTDFLRENPFPLIKNRKYIVNAGSVGQSRDLDPRACYVIYDGNNNSIEIVRLDYNIPRAQQKIIEAGLPDVLAERLLVGR